MNEKLLWEELETTEIPTFVISEEKKNATIPIS